MRCFSGFLLIILLDDGIMLSLRQTWSPRAKSKEQYHFVFRNFHIMKITQETWISFLLQLTVACIKTNRPEIAARAVEVAERHIARDRWPEYYDTKKGRFIGKQARLFQTWSIAGYLVAKLLLNDPSSAKILITDEDSELINAFSCMISANPRRMRGRKNPKQTYIV